jgi:hypothetical protein
MTNEPDSIEITYDNSGNSKISCLATVYFKIEGISQKKAAELIGLENISHQSLDELNSFLYPPTDEIIRKANKQAIQTTVSPMLNNWCYIIWTISWYDECKVLVEKLCAETDTKISCFFIDPWTAHYFWAIADNGSIIREFEYDEEIKVDIGLPLCLEEKAFIQNLVASKNETMENWIKNRENPFIGIENVYIELIKRTGQHIELLNTATDNSKNYICGTVNIE